MNTIETIHNAHNLVTDKIKVYGTKEGDLYILASDLFSLDKVKALLIKVSNSPALKNVHKVEKLEDVG